MLNMFKKKKKHLYYLVGFLDSANTLNVVALLSKTEEDAEYIRQQIIDMHPSSETSMINHNIVKVIAEQELQNNDMVIVITKCVNGDFYFYENIFIDAADILATMVDDAKEEFSLTSMHIYEQHVLKVMKNKEAIDKVFNKLFADLAPIDEMLNKAFSGK